MTHIEQIKRALAEGYAAIQDARGLADTMGRPDIASRARHCEDLILELARLVQAEPLPRSK